MGSFLVRLLFGSLLTFAIYQLCFVVEQNSGVDLLGYYGLAFVSYFLLVYVNEEWNTSSNKFYILVGLGLALRVLLIFSFPNLSDDVYRFVWDGTMIKEGINPLSFTPTEFMESGLAGGRYLELYPLLNSPDYHTVYPPVSQFIYYLGALCPMVPLSVALMKGFLLLAEIGSLLLIVRLLDILGKPKHWSLLYFLNPLVIVELVGQLHFEAIMIFFLLGAIVLLYEQRYVTSGVALGLAIGAKLLPLMFVPLMLGYLKERSAILKLLLGLAIVVLTLFVALFWSADIFSFFKSINLYFQSFEFNASIYYLVRAIGFWWTGYNEIAVIGPLLSLISLGVIFYLSLWNRAKDIQQLLIRMFWILSVYLFLTTTVHPWYLCMLVMLGLFSRQWWAILWSGVVVLSYMTYVSPDFIQPLGLIAIEYLLVFSLLIYSQKFQR